MVRSARETQFTVTGFTPEVLGALSRPGSHVRTLEMGLEDIFIDLVKPALALGESSPVLAAEEV